MKLAKSFRVFQFPSQLVFVIVLDVQDTSPSGISKQMDGISDTSFGHCGHGCRCRQALKELHELHKLSLDAMFPEICCFKLTDSFHILQRKAQKATPRSEETFCAQFPLVMMCKNWSD